MRQDDLYIGGAVYRESLFDKMTCKAMYKATPFGKLVEMSAVPFMPDQLRCQDKQGVVLKKVWRRLFVVKGGNAKCVKRV